jgi:photosystem II stability/assembly factor-like uncharacterized protein
MNKLIAQCLAFIIIASLAPSARLHAQDVKIDSDTISGLGARNIGAAVMSGRIAALAAVHEKGRLTIYIGAASGGVWRSLNGGTAFKPMFDKQPVQSIGAIAIDPSHPKTVWVGTGEAWTRNSASIGDGVYKSTDGGENWTNVGLKESERVAKIIVDPADGNTVYACVPGKLWSDSEERGVYKTTNGGATWTKILKGANLSTGCSMISMSSRDPKMLYAGMWDFRRKGWTFRSGGDTPTAFSGSGLFVTSDGGANWTDLNEKTAKGLPPKPWGRVAVTAAPSNPNVVYALIESPQSALYRSDDAGKSWERRDASQFMVWRPFYFANLIVDPKDENRLYKTDYGLIMSTDGGRSFSFVSGGAHGDFHDVWVDPERTDSLISGDDGGVWFSYDGADTWWKANNLPVSQFYHVAVDNEDPYHVYGGLQDNANWIGDSSYPGGITNSRWECLGGGDGFWVIPDPSDPNYVYEDSQGGEISRINRRTLQARGIKPLPNYGEGKLRFNWNAPIYVSPNEPGTVYIGAQFLFRSRDHGQSWERISPDLTTNDPEKQKQEESGGVTVDNSDAETHTTIYSISESPLNGNTLWVGTDDGNLQLTRDGGKTWTNVVGNVPILPKCSWVSWVEASRYDPAAAYAVFDRHTFGDMEPYVFKTADYGKTWAPIVGPGSGVRGYAHVIKEDTVLSNLLFVGTEFGLWISLDSGHQWAQYKGGEFPNVAVRDIAIQPRESDVVLATHGRGIWIIDDITPLRKLTPEVLSQDAVFLEGGPIRQRLMASGGWMEGDASFNGPNPQDAALITYYQKKRHIFGKMKIEVLDDQGRLVETLPANSRRGLTRVPWSMTLKPPRVPPAASLSGATVGPRVLPGSYTIRMTRGDQVFTTQLRINLDPRATYTAEDRKLQLNASTRVRDLLGDMSYDVDNIGAVHEALLARMSKLAASDPLRKTLSQTADKAENIRKKIVATKTGGAITGELRLREYAIELYDTLTYYEGRPGDYQVARIDSLKRELDDVVKQFDDFLAKDVTPLNQALARKKLDPVRALPRTEWEKTSSVADLDNGNMRVVGRERER